MNKINNFLDINGYLDLSFNSIIEDENLNNDFRVIAKNNKKITNLIDDLNYINNNNLLCLLYYI